MKKFTVSLFAFLFSLGHVYSQANLSVLAPPYLTTSQLRAPNGLVSQSGMRGCFLVLQSELSSMVLTNNVISSFGFSLTAGTAAAPVTGSITIWIQNTADATYLKGTTWGVPITTGMTQVYSGNMTVPASNSAVSIILPITNFPYSGTGLYVAYDWASIGPFGSSPATYCANGSGLTIGGASTDSPTLPTPTSLTTTNFRPSFIFVAANTATNEIQVSGVTAPGKVAFLLNSPHVVTSVIKNASNVTRNNIAVGLNITGTNPLVNSIVTISSLAAGASTTISFPAYNPLNPGLSAMTVTVAPDQLNSNNSATWSQSVTCNFSSTSPPSGAFTSGIGYSSGSGILCNRVTPPITTNLSGARIAFSSDAAALGNTVYAVLLNATGGIIATSNNITIAAGTSGIFQNFIFSPAVNVTGGTNYYLGLAVPSGTPVYFPLGSLTAANLPAGLNYSIPIAGGAITTIAQNLGYFGIDAVYAPNGLLLNALQSSAVSCKGDAVTFSASGMSTYTWTGFTSTAGSFTTAPTASATYTVIGTDQASQCTNISVVTHSVINFNITVVTNSTSAICRGRSARLTASGASTYSWSNTTTLGSTVNITPTVTTTYTVFGFENTLGCKSNSATVTQNVNACTAISVNGLSLPELRIFPNPSVHGKLEISGLSGLNTIIIYNVLGQVVFTLQCPDGQLQVDLSAQPSGTYLIKVMDTDNNSKTIKIVNQN